MYQLAHLSTPVLSREDKFVLSLLAKCAARVVRRVLGTAEHGLRDPEPREHASESCGARLRRLFHRLVACSDPQEANEPASSPTEEATAPLARLADIFEESVFPFGARRRLPERFRPGSKQQPIRRLRLSPVC
ncbi:hypothetical protein ISCGN_000687 [Ixodes scapularis]